MEGADDDDEADDDGPTGGVSESDIPADLRSGGKTIKRPSAKARSQKKPAATRRHEFLWGAHPLCFSLCCVSKSFFLPETFLYRRPVVMHLWLVVIHQIWGWCPLALVCWKFISWILTMLSNMPLPRTLSYQQNLPLRGDGYMNPELFPDNQLGIYSEFPATPSPPNSGSKASWLVFFFQSSKCQLPSSSHPSTLPPLKEMAAMALPHEIPELAASRRHVDLFVVSLNAFDDWCKSFFVLIKYQIV